MLSHLVFLAFIWCCSGQAVRVPPILGGGNGETAYQWADTNSNRYKTITCGAVASVNISQSRLIGEVNFFSVHGNGQLYRNFVVYPFPSPDSLFPGNTSLISATLVFNLANWSLQPYWSEPYLGVSFGSKAWQLISDRSFGWPGTYRFSEFPANIRGASPAGYGCNFAPTDPTGGYPVRLGVNNIDVTKAFSTFLADAPLSETFSMTLGTSRCSLTSNWCEIIPAAAPYLLIEAN